MMNGKTWFHPSNKLYNGDCKTVEDALETLMAAYQHEAMVLRRGEPDALDIQLADQLDNDVNVVEAILHEYTRAKEDLETYFANKWIGRDSNIIRAIGEAVLEEDYSRLAI